MNRTAPWRLRAVSNANRKRMLSLSLTTKTFIKMIFHDYFLHLLFVCPQCFLLPFCHPPFIAFLHFLGDSDFGISPSSLLMHLGARILQTVTERAKKVTSFGPSRRKEIHSQML